MKCRQCGQEAICEWHLGLFGPSLPFCSRACMNQYQQEHELSAPPSLLHRLVAVLDRLHLPERLVVLDGDHSSKPAFCTVCGVASLLTNRTTTSRPGMIRVALCWTWKTL